MVEQGRCRHFSVSELANVSNKAPHGCEPLRSRISKAKELLPKEQLRCQERRLGQPTPGINDYLGESYKAYVFLVGEVRIVSSFEHQSIKLGKILAIINLAQQYTRGLFRFLKANDWLTEKWWIRKTDLESFFINFKDYIRNYSSIPFSSFYATVCFTAAKIGELLAEIDYQRSLKRKTLNSKDLIATTLFDKENKLYK